MKKISLILTIIIAAAVFAATGFCQQLVEPNELKLNPPRYKNSYIKIHDNFVLMRAAIPFPLPQAGYTLEKYLTFGAAKSGMRCLMRRDIGNEEKVAQFKNGDRITIYGYVKQPRATYGKGVKVRRETERYIIEVRDIRSGWE